MPAQTSNIHKKSSSRTNVYETHWHVQFIMAYFRVDARYSAPSPRIAIPGFSFRHSNIRHSNLIRHLSFEFRHCSGYTSLIYA